MIVARWVPLQNGKPTTKTQEKEKQNGLMQLIAVGGHCKLQQQMLINI